MASWRHARCIRHALLQAITCSSRRSFELLGSRPCSVRQPFRWAFFQLKRSRTSQAVVAAMAGTQRQPSRQFCPLHQDQIKTASCVSRRGRRLQVVLGCSEDALANVHQNPTCGGEFWSKYFAMFKQELARRGLPGCLDDCVAVMYCACTFHTGGDAAATRDANPSQ